MSRVGYYGGLINLSTCKSCGGSNPPNGTQALIVSTEPVSRLVIELPASDFEMKICYLGRTITLLAGGVYGCIAQLVRASVRYTEGCRFEFYYTHNTIIK